ncbi:MAG: SUMF1/EgtB/PvdO family nonheme iron enzyme, partial [Deinococcus sp.]|nr:SUMF1/EgtB/PvdO family nonheme iron enzyme [Deinococcus sp.]
EAQREKAARGGLEGQEYPWGNVIPDTVPVKGGRDSRPPQAGSTPPNGYGLYHLADGVHEWCADWYRPGYYASAPRHNPPGPPTGQRRSARGGSWRHHFAVSRCAARSSLGPAYRYSDFGFRCASPSP